MSINTIITVIIFSAFNLGIANCLINPFQSSKLPETMPENTRMAFSENGGMAPTWYRIEIEDDQLLIEKKDFQDDQGRIFFAEISPADKTELYQVFVTNKFDTIENEKREEIVYDAGSEGIDIRAGKISKHVSYGPNSPLSAKNLTRYKNTVGAFRRIAEKYKPMLKERRKNIAVIDFDPKKYAHIFKDGIRTRLNDLEIEKIESIVTTAVSEYNSGQTGNNNIPDLTKYKKQFLAVTNIKGEKEIYVNLFCAEMPNWQKELVDVEDGGNCFFNLFVNLSQNTYRNLKVNGEA